MSATCRRIAPTPRHSITVYRCNSYLKHSQTFLVISGRSIRRDKADAWGVTGVASNVQLQMKGAN